MASTNSSIKNTRHGSGNPTISISLLLDQEDIWVGGVLPFLGTGQFAFVGAVSKKLQQHYKTFCATSIAQSDNRVRVRDFVWRDDGTIALEERPTHVTDTHYATAFYNMESVQFWKDSLIPTSTTPTTTISNQVATCGNVPEDPFEWLVARERNSKILRLEAIQRAIAHGGSIAVLKWALQHDYLRTTNPGTMALFALHGHIQACQFLRNKQNCPWNESATANAALNGHLKTLKWLRANNCPWNERTCTNAAKNGHLHVLQYARDNHCPWNEHYLCQTAAGHGQIHILQWLAEQGLVLHHLFDELTCLKAVQHGQLEVVQWLHAQHLWREGNYCFCDEAAGSGHLHVLKWLVDKGLSHCDATTSEFASLSKNWDVLKFLHDLGCHHAGGYLDAARQNGELPE